MPKIMGYNENRDLPTKNWEFHGGFMGISLKRIGARPLGSFSAKYWRLHQHRAWGSIMFNPCPKKAKMYKYTYIYKYYTLDTCVAHLKYIQVRRGAKYTE